jgi:hypothetical protein
MALGSKYSYSYPVTRYLTDRSCPYSHLSTLHNLPPSPIDSFVPKYGWKKGGGGAKSNKEEREIKKHGGHERRGLWEPEGGGGGGDKRATALWRTGDGEGDANHEKEGPCAYWRSQDCSTTIQISKGKGAYKASSLWSWEIRGHFHNFGRFRMSDKHCFASASCRSGSNPKSTDPGCQSNADPCKSGSKPLLVILLTVLLYILTFYHPFLVPVHGETSCFYLRKNQGCGAGAGRSRNFWLEPEPDWSFGSGSGAN